MDAMVGRWFARRSQPSRHLSYFELREALASPGCPVCQLTLRSAHRFLQSLSYEGVNDPGLRSELRAARGFCNWHAWYFVDEIGDGLGVALIYRDIIGALLGVLNEPERHDRARRYLPSLGVARGSRTDLPERLLPERACPACLRVSSAASRYLGVLRAHLAERDFLTAYEASDGLCRPHLELALAGKLPSELPGLLTNHLANLLRSRASDVAAVALTAELLVGRSGALPTSPAPSGTRSDGQLEALAEEASHVCQEADTACPICTGIVAAATASLRRLAVEPPAAGLALCNRHVWRLLALSPPELAAARLQEWATVAAVAVPRALATSETARAARPDVASFSALQRHSSGGIGAGSVATRETCPVCATEVTVEHLLVKRLLAEGDSGPGPASRGLCLRHCGQALSLAANSSAFTLIADSQASIYRELVAELDEFIRKCDYRFAQVPMGNEAGSPRRAIASISGERGLA